MQTHIQTDRQTSQNFNQSKFIDCIRLLRYFFFGFYFSFNCSQFFFLVRSYLCLICLFVERREFYSSSINYIRIKTEKKKYERMKCPDQSIVCGPIDGFICLFVVMMVIHLVVNINPTDVNVYLLIFDYAVAYDADHRLVQVMKKYLKECISEHSQETFKGINYRLSILIIILFVIQMNNE